ncbi:MAG: hypothetical protein M1549_02950 [Candidatus Dependentiae bacterium]|nr:hypothetical protein [Candidatus Dependentiae bacterium]
MQCKKTVGAGLLGCCLVGAAGALLAADDQGGGVYIWPTSKLGSITSDTGQVHFAGQAIEDAALAKKIKELSSTKDKKELSNFVNQREQNLRFGQQDFGGAEAISPQTATILLALIRYGYYQSINALLETGLVKLDYNLGASNFKPVVGDHLDPLCSALDAALIVAKPNARQAVFDVLRSHGAGRFITQYGEDDLKAKYGYNGRHVGKIKTFFDAVSGYGLDWNKSYPNALCFNQAGTGTVTCAGAQKPEKSGFLEEEEGKEQERREREKLEREEQERKQREKEQGKLPSEKKPLTPPGGQGEREELGLGERIPSEGGPHGGSESEKNPPKKQGTGGWSGTSSGSTSTQAVDDSALRLLAQALSSLLGVGEIADFVL